MREERRTGGEVRADGKGGERRGMGSRGEVV